MLKTITVISASLLAAGLFTMGTAHAELENAEHKVEKERIEATYKTDKAACDKLAGNAKDVCMAEAKGKQRVAKAELEYKRSGNDKHARDLAQVKAKTQYEIAKEKCDDLSGNAKDACVKEAKTNESKALTDIKAAAHVQEVTKDAAQDKQDLDYKVAIEKCDALSGDAKNSCEAEAKARFGRR